MARIFRKDEKDRPWKDVVKEDFAEKPIKDWKKTIYRMVQINVDLKS